MFQSPVQYYLIKWFLFRGRTDLITPYLQHSSYKVREIAAQLLGKSNDPRVVLALLPLLNDRVNTVVDAVIKSLRKFYLSPTQEKLIEAKEAFLKTEYATTLTPIHKNNTSTNYLPKIDYHRQTQNRLIIPRKEFI